MLAVGGWGCGGGASGGGLLDGRVVQDDCNLLR